jgi:hypothetical protein
MVSAAEHTGVQFENGDLKRTTLLNVAITTAVAGLVGTVFQVRGRDAERPAIMAAQGTFVGTAGTSCTWWLQTSLDQGISWSDALAYAHVAAGRAGGVICSNPGAGAAPVLLTDGTATSPFVQSGIFGSLWRIKYSSLGTWTLGNLRVDVDSDGIVSTGTS